LNNSVFKILLPVCVLATLALTALSFQQSSQKHTDAIESAQKPSPVSANRPETEKTNHDTSTVFVAANAEPSSPVFMSQPKAGRVSGFDFYRDPLNSDRPFMTFDEIFKKESANKAAVMKAQMAYLETRFNLAPKLDPQAKMSRGKPLAVGPTAKLVPNLTWDQLGQMPPADIQAKNVFPYRSLPHPLQANGGQVFPKVQIDMFPRLERFDVDFDIPDAFIPEFPPAIRRRLTRRGCFDQ